MQGLGFVYLPSLSITLFVLTFACHPYIFLQDVSRHTPISPINSSEQYYLVDVVAFILKYLKDQLYEMLGRTDLYMGHVQIDWVVAVPAIWGVCGKEMMREAAYLVCK